jgi:hypothetical protein
MLYLMDKIKNANLNYEGIQTMLACIANRALYDILFCDISNTSKRFTTFNENFLQ